MKHYALILSLILTLLPLGAHAQTPAIDAGVGYLTSSQNPDRSWGGAGSSTGTVTSTVAVLDTLKMLNQSDLYEYSGAISWLQTQSLDTTENLSERIQALTAGGTDQDKLVAYIDTLMHAWGGNNEFSVNIIDTVYAIQALKTANYSDHAVFASALAFLSSCQNTDGGWGFYKGDKSNTYVTSLVLSAFSRLKATYTGLQPVINTAAAYVLSKQNADGGFGSSPSSVHETALAYEALVASGIDVSASTPLAIDYLGRTQQANGSWDNDPYETALALKALSDVKPNLSIASTDITLARNGVSGTTFTVNEQITLSAMIRNTGMVAATQVAVAIYDKDPATGASPILSQIIPSVASGGTYTLTVPYIVGASGNITLYLWIDPSGSIAEVTKDDNIASKSLWGATWPDIAVFPEDITPSTSYPATGASFDVLFKLRNLGETEGDELT